MKKLLFLFALLIFACSSELFCQDYMKMNKKNLRLEYQKKLNQIDSLKQVLNLTYSENQNLQSNLNNANNDLSIISDSLKNSNLEISQLEAKLLNSKNELSQLGLEIDNLVKQNSDNLGLITNKNLQIDSLRTSLNIASEEKNDLISQDSLKATIITTLNKDKEELYVTIQNKQRYIYELTDNFNSSKTKKLFLNGGELEFDPIESYTNEYGAIRKTLGYSEYEIYEADGEYWFFSGITLSGYLIDSVILDKILDTITIYLDGYAEEHGEDNYPFQVPAEERKIVIRRLNGLYYFKNDPKAYIIYGDFKWTNLPN